MKPEITVREIVQTNVLTCSPQTPLAEAARRMVDGHCSSILIEDGGRIVGIWTEQDALRLDLSAPAYDREPISASMSAPVKTLPDHVSIGEAALRFREERVRHFVVLDGSGRHRGIVSQSDIVINQGIEYFVALREVKAVFNRRHLTIAATTPVHEAVAQMRRDGLDAVIVEHPHYGPGIVTERDVVRLVCKGVTLTTVGELASYPLISLSANDSLYRARKLFVDKHVRHLGVTDDAGALVGLITFADILANIEHQYVHHLREALRESQSKLEASSQHLRLAAKAFESTFEGIVVTDAKSRIESVNPAFTQITGYAAEDVLGKTPAVLSSGRHDADFYRDMYAALEANGYWQGEICNRRKNGEIYVEWLNINAVRDADGRVTNYVAVFSDFTSRKAAEEHIRFLAQHDALTKLPNRNLLRERLVRAIPHAQRNEKKLAVIFLDLDDFKKVNDSFGHAAGDHMLKTVAQRLTDCVRAEDTVARLAGDEFLVVLEEIGSGEAVGPIVHKVMAALNEPIGFEGRAMTVTASIGISLFPDDGRTPDDLVKHADAAMYASKDLGRNTFRFFSEIDS